MMTSKWRAQLRALKDKAKESVRSRGFDIVRVPGTHYEKISFLDIVSHLLNDRHSEVQVLQVGANDGKRDDPLHHLISANKNWQALLIEPLETVFKELQKNYASFGGRVLMENLAVSQQNESLTLHYLDSADKGNSVFASADLNHLLKYRQSADDKIRSVVVPCMTVTKLLELHNIENLHLLVVDTEGHDLDVLQSIDFSKHRPTVIQFESGHLPFPGRREAFELLSSQGYLLQWDGLNSYAVLPE